MAEGDGAAQVFKEVKISFDDFAKSFDQYADRLKETEALWRSKMDIWKNMSGDAAAGTGTSSSTSTSGRDLTRRYQTESLRYYKDFHATVALGKGVGGGLLGLAKGEGLEGFSRGLMDFGRAMRGGGSFTQLLSGLTGASLLGRGGRRAGAGAAVAAEAEEGGAEIAEAVKVGASTGIGMGLISAFQKLPGVVKLGIGAIATLAGVDLAGMTLASRDVYDRSRRAKGYGANVGELTAFEDTMGRFVDTGATMAAMRSAKYDITSPERIGLQSIGINPSEWKDPAAMAEGTIMKTQTWLKNYAAQHGEGTLLSAAHARKLPFSDEDLIRMYRGDEGQIRKMIALAQSKAGDLDIPEKQQEAYNDLVTNITLAGDELKTFGENILSVQIPTFNAWAKTLEDWMKKYQNLADVPGEGETAPGGGGGIFRPSTGRVTGGGGEAEVGNLGVRGFWTPEKEKIAYDKLVAGGFTPDAAMGYISRWRYVESSGGPTSVNPGSHAFGIAQALGPRKPGYLAAGTDFEKQLDQVVRESKGFGGEKSGYLARSAHGDVEAGKAATAFERAENYSPGSHTDRYTARTIAGVAKVREDLEKLGVKTGTGPQSMNDLSNFQGAQPKYHIGMNITNQAGANTIVSSGMLGSGSGNFRVA